MDVNILFLLLFHFIYNGYGIPQTNNGYRNQTWNEATNDNTCSLIGLNFTGGIEENLQNISSSIFSGTYERAWIGAYAKRVWINFEGCYFGTFVRTDSWITLVSHRDPAKSCLRHCNFSGFVLAEDKCVCSKDVVSFESGCKAMKCVNTKYRYCGERTTPGITRFHCMCRFSVENNSSYKSDEGDCLSICYDPNTKKVDLSRGSNNWLHSWSECFNNNKQFASRTTNVTGIQNGTYWVGTFAVTYKEWGRPRSADYNCVAVSIDRTNDNLTTVVLPCDTLLPAVCLTSSLSTHSTTETTVNVVTTDSVTASVHFASTTRLDKTSSSDQQTTSLRPAATSLSSLRTEINGLSSSSPTNSAYNASKSSQSYSSMSTIVGLVVTSVVILILAFVVLVLRRRGVFRKTQTARSNTTGDIPETRNSGETDNSRIDAGITDDVYNHFGELSKVQDLSDEDLYDHTGTEGEIYGHLNNNRYEEDSEYDHAFNHKASDTYGRLNSTFRHDDDNEYDHTCSITPAETYGQLNRNIHQSDNESDYDHTGDMYGRLHAGKYQDVGDDVYDHTGGLGNVYGHINISKPEVENEYDHSRVSHGRTQSEVDSEYDYTHVTHKQIQPEVNNEYDQTRATHGCIGQHAFTLSEATDLDNVTSTA